MIAQTQSGSGTTNYFPVLLQERRIDWGNSGRLGGIPESYQHHIKITSIKYIGTTAQKIQAAIDDASNIGLQNNTIVPVVIPAGNYTITQPLILKDNVVL